jgi:hypothetical protein
MVAGKNDKASPSPGGRLRLIVHFLCVTDQAAIGFARPTKEKYHVMTVLLQWNQPAGGKGPIVHKGNGKEETRFADSFLKRKEGMNYDKSRSH